MSYTVLSTNNGVLHISLKEPVEDMYFCDNNSLVFKSGNEMPIFRIDDFSSSKLVSRNKQRNKDDLLYTQDVFVYLYSVEQKIYAVYLEKRDRKELFSAYQDTDRRLMADHTDRYVAIINKNSLIVWDFMRDHITEIQHEDTKQITAAAFSPNGNYLFVSNEKGTIFVWQISDSMFLQKHIIKPDMLGHLQMGIALFSVKQSGGRVLCCYLKEDYQTIGCIQVEEDIHCVEPIILPNTSSETKIASISLADMEKAYIAKSDGTILKHSILTSGDTLRIELDTPVRKAAFSPDNRYVALYNEQEMLRISLYPLIL